MSPARRYITQGQEHKQSFRDFGVREPDVGILQNPCPIVQQVQINRARLPLGAGQGSAHPGLDCVQVPQQVWGCKRRLDCGDGIQKIGLRIAVGDCRGFVQRRFCRYTAVENIPQKIYSGVNERDAIALIAADADECERHIFCNRCTASSNFSGGAVSEKRTYPSPNSPNPVPGVMTTPVFSMTCTAKSLAVIPLGEAAQT